MTLKTRDLYISSSGDRWCLAAIDGKVNVDVLPNAGIVGNGHTLMLEKNNHEILQRMLNWLAGVLPEARVR